MPEHRTDQALPEQEAGHARLTISAGLFVTLFIVTASLACIGTRTRTRYFAFGNLDRCLRAFRAGSVVSSAHRRRYTLVR